jgi:hypothetical protein
MRAAIRERRWEEVDFIVTGRMITRMGGKVKNDSVFLLSKMCAVHF